MNRKTMIQRIDSLEAAARLIIAEATLIRKSISPVSGRAPRKGKRQPQTPDEIEQSAREFMAKRDTMLRVKKLRNDTRALS